MSSPGTLLVGEPPPLSLATAQALVERAHRLGGLAVSADKRDFIRLRVSRRLREIDCPDFETYLDILSGPLGAVEAPYLVEALTTHTTAFFRERQHYDWLAAEGLEALVAAGAGRDWTLTVWSAACSLGSEMWTAGMVLDRFAAGRPGGLRWGLVGTDISRQILRRASTAVFMESEIEGLPEPLRQRYLLRSRTAGPTGDLYRVAPELRCKARLALANLVRLDPGFTLTADVAFLRNVLIYFNPEDRLRAVGNVVSRLRVGGYLLTGHSESLSPVPKGLTQIASSIYQKV